jgi:hypothetical protein
LEPIVHETGTGDADHRFGNLNLVFTIFAEPAMASEPGKAAFDGSNAGIPVRATVIEPMGEQHDDAFTITHDYIPGPDRDVATVGVIGDFRI